MAANEIDQQTTIPFIWIFIVLGFIIPILVGVSMWLQTVYSNGASALTRVQTVETSVQVLAKQVQDNAMLNMSALHSQKLQLNRIEDKVDYLKARR